MAARMNMTAMNSLVRGQTVAGQMVAMPGTPVWSQADVDKVRLLPTKRLLVATNRGEPKCERLDCMCWVLFRMSLVKKKMLLKGNGENRRSWT